MDDSERRFNVMMVKIFLFNLLSCFCQAERNVIVRKRCRERKREREREREREKEREREREIKGGKRSFLNCI